MLMQGPTLLKNSVASPAILSFRPNSVENDRLSRANHSKPTLARIGTEFMCVVRTEFASRGKCSKLNAADTNTFKYL